MLWPRIFSGGPEFELLRASRGLGLCALLVSFGLGTGGCGGSLRSSRPNVLLVTLDTVRADHCSVYGYGRDTTPNLQRLAARSVIFESAYAPMATTGPSHATMFTSLYPRTHGFLKNGYVLDEGFVTLGEMFHGMTYQTAAVVGSYAVSSKFGFSQGFDHFDDEFGSGGYRSFKQTWEGHTVDGLFDRDGSQVTDRAVRWLSDEWNPSNPFFLWAHYFDAHAPYAPAPGFRDVFHSDRDNPESLASIESAYDEEILEVDHAIGRLFDFLDASDLVNSTVVVVIGDHGEGLMQHGHLEHGLQLYEEAVRIPFLISWPRRIKKSRSVVQPVELLDLMPTILDLVGCDKPGPGKGRSLRSVLVDDALLDPLHPVFFERRFYSPGRVGNFDVSGEKFAVRSGRWKFIVAKEEGTTELYDLTSDPGERLNLALRDADVSERMRRMIDRWYTINTPEARVQAEEIDEADLAGLRSLGYVD